MEPEAQARARAAIWEVEQQVCGARGCCSRLMPQSQGAPCPCSQCTEAVVPAKPTALSNLIHISLHICMAAQALKDMQLMPGVPELCAFLDEKRIPRGLVTRNVKASVDVLHQQHLAPLHSLRGDHSPTRSAPCVWLGDTGYESKA